MKKAFTLVELLIVIIIIGILATLAIPQYQRMVNRARWSEAMSLADAIKTAENLYYVENNAFRTGASANLGDLSTLDLPVATARQFRFSLRNPDMIYAYHSSQNAADDIALTASAGENYFVVNLTSNATSYRGNAPGSL